MPPTPLPLVRPIVIYRGRTFRSPLFRLKDGAGNPVNLTGMGIAARLAKSISQEEAERIADFDIERTDEAGEFRFVLADTATRAIDGLIGGGFYDVELTDTLGTATQYVQGPARIAGTVTP